MNPLKNYLDLEITLKVKFKMLFKLDLSISGTEKEIPFKKSPLTQITLKVMVGVMAEVAREKPYSFLLFCSFHTFGVPYMQYRTKISDHYMGETGTNIAVDGNVIRNIQSRIVVNQQDR